jgi:hypothetical protein
MTPEAITVLDELQTTFYTPSDLNVIIGIVANNFFILIVVLLGTYPFLMILKKLIRYCETAFDMEVIRKMEGGGIWSKLPDGSLHTSLDKIASVKVFDKMFKKGGAIK